jgi:hypothetical protein
LAVAFLQFFSQGLFLLPVSDLMEALIMEWKYHLRVILLGYKQHESPTPLYNQDKPETMSKPLVENHSSWRLPEDVLFSSSLLEAS